MLWTSTPYWSEAYGFRAIFWKFQIRLIVEHFPKLNHLDFRFCQLKELDENALESFREFGVRLRSLTFFETVSLLGTHLN